MQAMTLQNFGPQNNSASSKFTSSFNMTGGPAAFNTQTMVGASQQINPKRMELFSGGANQEMAPNQLQNYSSGPDDQVN